MLTIVRPGTHTTYRLAWGLRMFEFFGAILRFPVALAWIAFLFITWPIGLGFLALFLGGALLVSPFKFAASAFSGDKSGWEAWQKEYLDLEGLAKSIFYPITMIPNIFKWVEKG